VANSRALPEGNIYGNIYVDQVLSMVRNPAQLRFRNCIAMENLAAMRARGVQFIMLHKRFEAQLPGVLLEPTADLERLEGLYRGKVGPPVYQDTFITVFRL
jgi:hypothetical protein